MNGIKDAIAFKQIFHHGVRNNISIFWHKYISMSRGNNCQLRNAKKSLSCLWSADWGGLHNEQPGVAKPCSTAREWDTLWEEALSSALSPTSTCQECPDGSCGEQWVSLIVTSGDLVMWSCSGGSCPSRLLWSGLLRTLWLLRLLAKRYINSW